MSMGRIETVIISTTQLKVFRKQNDMKSSLIFYRERNWVLVSNGREKVSFGEL